uniref:Uncharacterized protein n=1 Tax=Oryza sativa subsp. japonica TaxID=39947 RepID=Q69Y19_ORYSJ|nr:hypothetical protein [Oryza sativa Japonica Group]BAD35308.1 hypothetical protein [Oryza sativa Japonica Group]
MSGGRVAAASGAERLRDDAGARSYATTDDDALEPVNPAARNLASYSGHTIATSFSGLARAADEEDDGLHARRSRRIVGCDGEYHRRHPARGISTPPPARHRRLPSSPARAARRRLLPPANRRCRAHLLCLHARILRRTPLPPPRLASSSTSSRHRSPPPLPPQPHLASSTAFRRRSPLPLPPCACETEKRKLDWTTRILNPKSAMEFHTPTIMMWAYGPIGSCYPVTAGVLIAKELEQAVTAKVFGLSNCRSSTSHFGS